MTTADSVVVFQKTSVWTGYTTITGGTITDETLIYGSIATLNSQVATLTTNLANLTTRVDEITGSGSSPGTVTSIICGTGLTGGTISTTGTIALDPAYSAFGIGSVSGIPGGDGSGVFTTVTVSAPLRYSSPTLSIQQSNAAQGGYLSNADWSTFNSKEPSLGNPTVNGSFLSSTAGGVRSWVAPTTGGTVTSIIAGAGLTGGTISTTGTIAVATTQNITTLSNLTGNGLVITSGGTGILGIVPTGSAGQILSSGQIPTGGTGFYSQSALDDWNYGSTVGSILARRTDQWGTIVPGTAGYALVSGGAGANPTWATFEHPLGNPGANGYVLASTTGGTRSWVALTTGGTVTSIVAGTGLTGGTITTSGTIALATSGVSAGSYGSGFSVGTFTVDTYGRITAAANTSISVSSPLVNSGSTISIPQAGGSTNGYLSSGDWSTFNAKQAAYANLSSLGTLANATGFLYNTGSGSLSWSPTGTYNVISYGADPTGSSSSTAAIQAAINAAVPLGGGIIQIPAGTYKITGELNFGPGSYPNSVNLVIQGAGHGLTQILQYTAGANGFSFVLPALVASYGLRWQVNIWGITVISQQNTNLSGSAISMDWSNSTDNSGQFFGSGVHDVEIYSNIASGANGNGWNCGIYFKSMIHTTVEKIKICGPGANDNLVGYGIVITGSGGGQVYDNISIQGPQYGIYIFNGSSTGPLIQGLEFSNVNVLGCVKQVYIVGTTRTSDGVLGVGPVRFSDSEIDGTNGSVVIGGFKGMECVNCTNIQFDNGLLSASDGNVGSGGYGHYLLLNGCINSTFTGITSYGGITTGLHLTGNSNANVITNWVWQVTTPLITIDAGSNNNIVRNFTANGTISVTDSGSGNRANPNS
jgi:hypothetical protein